MKNAHSSKNVHRRILRIAARVSCETIDSNTKAEVLESLCDAYCCTPAHRRQRLVHLQRAYRLLQAKQRAVPRQRFALPSTHPLKEAAMSHGIKSNNSSSITPTAADIMDRKIATLYEEDNLVHVAEAMRRFAVRQLPVIDEQRLVGILDERDVLSLTTARARTSTFVAELMTPCAFTVAPSAPASEVARIFARGLTDTVFVVETGGSLVGVLRAKQLAALAGGILDESPSTTKGSDTARGLRLLTPVSQFAA